MTGANCIHLLDSLDFARIEAAERSHVQLQTFVIGHVSRATIFQHPVSRVIFPAMEIASGARLETHLAVKPSVWERIGGAVTFRLLARVPGAADNLIFERTLDPRQEEADRAWVAVEVLLERWAGQSVSLVLETRGDSGPVAYGWIGWGDPRLHMEPAGAPAVHRRARGKQTHPDIFLITCDALRADHLGCYGAPADRTPHIDALAAESLLFGQARAASDSTFASYVSMLTGRLPHETGVLAEWGEFPPHLPSLPVMLAGAGYHTLLAVSEEELGAPAAGLSRVFHDVVPCLGNPAQATSVTTRRLIERIRRIETDRPLFVWLQLFDPHPPNLPEPEFASRFYEGSPAREFQPEIVGQIHGIETCLHLEHSRASLARGIVPRPLLHRLNETVRAMRGDLAKGPDLAFHLDSLGAAAWNGMGRDEFVEWLADELRLASRDSGRGSARLLEWLAQLDVQMRRTERDLLAWLDGVRDRRFPEAMYAAVVSSVDHWIGRFLATLRETGRHDDALIVFTAPHGEMLAGTPPLTFEHHFPIEEVLRVPLIIKPPHGSGRRGRIDRPTGLAGLGATLLELAGVPGIGPFDPARSLFHPESSDPVARGEVTVSMQAEWVTLTRGSFKLARRRAGDETAVWPLLRCAPEANSQFLLFTGDGGPDETRDASREHPGVLREMTAELERHVPEAACLLAALEPTRYLRTGVSGREADAFESAQLDAQDRRTVVERVERVSKTRLQAMRQEMNRLQKDLKFVTRLLQQLRGGIARLYKTRRWRLANLLRSGPRAGFAPVDALLEKLSAWQPHSGKSPRVHLDMPELYSAWRRSQRLTDADLGKLRARAEQSGAGAAFCLVMPVPSDAREPLVREAVQSVLDQCWARWRLIITGAGERLRAALPADDRIRFAEATGLPKEATHFAGIGAEDCLEPQTLAEIALAFAPEAGPEPAQLVYTDEDEISDKGTFSNPFFKPAWSPDTLESMDCVGALAMYSRDLLEKLGARLESLHPDHAYDLVLRAAEQPGFRAVRLAQMLYHRRQPRDNTRGTSGLRALNEALQRRGEAAVARPFVQGVFHVRRALYKRERVSILIPTRDRLELLRRCVESLTAITAYDNFEIVILNNDSREARTLEWLARCGHRVLDCPGPFNYAAMNNAAVRTVANPWLLFLNNDTEIIEPHWLSAMAEHVQRPEIAAVGAKLLFPDGLVQHAGVVLGIQGRAAHAFAGRPAHDAGARAQLQCVRNYSAVTAACMMMRRAVFTELGGFDERRFPVAYNDVDLCARALRQGYRNVYTPHAVLKHHECASRPRMDNPGEVAAFREVCLGDRGWTDPYYHPVLDHNDASFALARY